MIPKIKLTNYNYELPDNRIAQYPVNERDTSKLLLYKDGNISSDIFRNIKDHIPSGSLLVFNNTRVIRARLLFQKETGAVIEIFCLEPLIPADYEQSFSSVRPVEWKCIIGNLKKWKSGPVRLKFKLKGKENELTAEKKACKGEALRIRFSWDNDSISFSEVMEAAGHIPLPPYVKRHDEFEDNVRYQTVYSTVRGSVAAPTAGLHFTENVLSGLNNRGIKCINLTLHIGAGTFSPVKTNDISNHEMHCEHFFITKEVIETLIKYRGRIIAIGTTSVRTLESLYWLGVKLLKKPDDGAGLNIEQWYPYEEKTEIPPAESFEAILRHMLATGKKSIQGSTTIIIVPGYKFRVTNGMVTNFHQPGSTLLLLVSAYTGEDWKKIYRFAMNEGFRFLSFGDCSLLLR